jgi:hypothetical protein
MKSIFALKDADVIQKIVFTANNLTSNAVCFLLLVNAKAKGIFNLIITSFIFDHPATNTIKMNHIKTMLRGHYIGIDRLERIKLLQGDPLDKSFGILVKEPESVFHFDQ